MTSITHLATALHHASTASTQAIKRAMKIMGSATIRAKVMFVVVAAMCAGTIRLPLSLLPKR